MAEMVWITSTAELDAELKRLGNGPLCLDVEADSFHHYPDKVCLVQLSFAGRDLLVDPLAGVDLAGLCGVLAAPQVRKILHGADYDIRVLHRDFGLELRGLFDTMVAARLVGERKFGLAALLEQHFGIQLDKRHQRADWSRRPLPPAMREYAALDTRYLGRLAEMLEARLAALGRREWAGEEFARLENVRWSSAAADPEAFRRVKQSAKLRPRELAVLRELYRLRDTVARRVDRPPFRVLRDEVLLMLARQQPQEASELDELRELPRGWTRPESARELMAAIGRGLELAEDALPRTPIKTRPRRSAAADAGLRRLRRIRDEALTDPDLLREAPHTAPLRRLDEVHAARQPVLRWQNEEEQA